ncbi:MAG: preprotein translocase subunit SecG [Candidatus Andersenbacteria bacterium RIFCSPHIGHO2_12_FULL_45_11b]|uniref:Protein-export membrane protein SecG n=1 Tax=Candidatus Andersenbacteria bacterium RIFCSPHIGHO2_12_FULL_45_11b TaxID=1797282 RepID=A0A1G1X8R9_9BACT|nr:MAG: preprotein translocase subunit SecG [Candidatus Andersenbacteria bacterium RIFCSPHIGHO2_12_FULL_45_11b]
MIWLNILFVVITVAMVTAILLQTSSTGLGSAFGGGAEGMHVRRGSEKRLFQITIVLAISFFLAAIAHLFIR